MDKTTDNTIKQFARPEVMVQIDLDEGRNVKFRVLRWTPTKVFKKLPELGSILAVPLVMYHTAEEFAGQDYEEKIGMALIQLFAGLEQRDLAIFLKDLLEETYTESGASVTENFDEIFILHPDLVLELATKVLEVNYGPFFKRGFANLLTQFKKIETLANK